MFSENLQYIFDLIILFLTSIIWLPLLILISIIIFLYQRKVFFIQERYGKNFKVFKIYKFMTIPPNTHINNISKFNRFLRRSSLDEIPQVYNILKKEMSLVGPRPIIVSKNFDKHKYNLKQKHKVLPGLTGLSQIKSKGTKRDLNVKINLDLMYIEKKNIFLYLYILFITLFIILKKYIKNKTGETL